MRPSRQLKDQHPIDASPILPPDPDRDSKAAVAFVAVLLLYGQLFGYGVWVATGVIEEKSSRVVEVLLSAIRARQLMAGKIAGIGVLGLLQLVFIAVVRHHARERDRGDRPSPRIRFSAAALTIGWFVLGFAFYAAMFAVAGALVSRMEELQNAIVPINLLVFASFLISIGAPAGSRLDDREGRVAAPDLLGARDARPDGARLGDRVGDRRVARVRGRLDRALDPAGGPGLRRSGAPHRREGQASRRMASGRVA